MKLAYYPGCSGQGTSIDYDSSTRAVFDTLGIPFEDIVDWNCCGSTPAHAVDTHLSAALSLRNLQLAAEQGYDTVTTPCPSCLSNLKHALHNLTKPGFKEKVEHLLGEPIGTLPQVKSTIQIILETKTVQDIELRVRNPLTGITVVPYYGCLMSRPKDVMDFDSEENPMSLDTLLTAIGITVPDFAYKVACCGGAQGIPRKEITSHLSSQILGAAKAAGADAVAVACPLCQMNLDMRQSQAAKYSKEKYDLPIFYFTQLIGLAFGLDEEFLKLKKLCVSPAPFLNKIAATEAAKVIGG